MIIVIIAVWITVGFASAFEVIEIYKKRKIYDSYPWNILSSPEDATLVIGSVLGFITLFVVLEYQYNMWRAKRNLKKLNKTFKSKEFQDILGKMSEDSAEKVRDSIKRFHKELDDYED